MEAFTVNRWEQLLTLHKPWIQFMIYNNYCWHDFPVGIMVTPRECALICSEIAHFWLLFESFSVFLWDLFQLIQSRGAVWSVSICLSHFWFWFKSLFALCLVGKSRGTVPSPSQSTGPVWIIPTWQSCATAVNSSKPSTTASLISWGGRDLNWEICPRWGRWLLGNNWAMITMRVALGMGFSVRTDHGLFKRPWLHVLIRPQLLLLIVQHQSRHETDLDNRL